MKLTLATLFFSLLLFLIACGPKEKKEQETKSHSASAVIAITLSTCGQAYLEIGSGAPLWIEARIRNSLSEGDLNLALFRDVIPILVTSEGSATPTKLKLVKPWSDLLAASKETTAIWKIEGSLAPGDYRVQFLVPEVDHPQIRRIKVLSCRVSVKVEPATVDMVAHLSRQFLLETEGPKAIVESVEVLARTRPDNISLQLELAELYQQLNRPKDQLKILVYSAHQMAGKKPGESISLQDLPCWMPGKIEEVSAKVNGEDLPLIK
ncbi:MAG: hypothetical protein QM496_02705 [Verrucomicrobiota bacterium]